MPATEDHLRLVPVRYRRSSGLLEEQFRIVRASERLFNYMLHPKGGAVRIRPSAECMVQTAFGLLVYQVDSVRRPQLAEAIVQFGRALRRPGHRGERFMGLYKSYECLQRQRDLEFSSVRHSLSHASAALSRPRTLSTLKRLFGGTAIHLERPDHERTFYRILVRLLVATDRILATSLRQTPRQYRGGLLGDGRIAGVPGSWDPVPLRPKMARHRLSNKPLQPTADSKLPFE